MQIDLLLHLETGLLACTLFRAEGACYDQSHIRISTEDPHSWMACRHELGFLPYRTGFIAALQAAERSACSLRHATMRSLFSCICLQYFEMSSLQAS
jgi:hypothetical protein